MKLTKFCNKCKTEKELEAFCKRHTTKDGRDVYCKECVSIYRKTNYKKIQESSSAYYQKYKEKVNLKNRNNRLKKEYNVTQEWYEKTLEEQEGKCKICKSDNPGKGLKHFHIDHNHETGKVRGLLCHSCNTGLGLFKENVDLIQKAIEYVEKHRQS